MRSITIEKFIDMLMDEESQVILSKLKLTDQGASNLILSRLCWLYTCLNRINKGRIEGKELIRFIYDSTEVLNKFNSIDVIDIVKLMKKIHSIELNVDGFMDMSEDNYSVGIMMIRVLSAYRGLLYRIAEDNYRNRKTIV